MRSLAIVSMLSIGASAAVDAPAQACGVLLSTTSKAAVEAMQTLLVVRKETLEIHARLSASGSDAAFAWVLPVPTDPVVTLGDAAVFDGLAFTQPSVTFATSGSGSGAGCGFGAAGSAAPGASQGSGGVTVLGGGKLGSYEYDVLAGTDAAAVVTWATDNGYTVPPGLEAALDPYAKAGMRFVVAQLDPEAADPDGYALDPLVVTVARPIDGTVSYPLALMALSGQPLNPVLLYVLADKRYRVANYGGTELQEFAKEIGKQGSDAQYDDVLDELTEAGDGRLFVTELAEDLQGDGVVDALAKLMDADAHYVTRLYARIPLAQLTDATVTYATGAGDVSNYAMVTAAGESASAWLWLAGLGLLACVQALRSVTRRPAS